MISSRRSLILGASAAIITRRALALAPAPTSFRNPLVFPGTTPGYNSNHVAAGPGTRYAGISTNGGMINLLNSKPATLHGSISGKITNIIGPTTLGSGSGAYMSQVAVNETPSTGVTMASILLPTSTTFWFLFNNNGNTGGVNSAGISGAGSLSLRFVVNNVTVVTTPITLSVGIPYFMAFSYNGSVGNSVITTLNKGVISSITNAIVEPFGTPTVSQYNIGGDSGANQTNASIAAIMYSINNYLSLPQLRQWAAAPWDFWYSPTTQNLMASGLTSPAAGGIAHNLLLQGVGQ